MDKIYRQMGASHGGKGKSIMTDKASAQRSVHVVPHGRLADEAEPIDILAHDALQAITGLVRNFPKIEPMLRRGKFQLQSCDTAGDNRQDINGAGLIAPIQADRLDLIPHVAGSDRGRGKAILGLTLIGLSFVPGVNASVAQGFSSLGGGPATATAFQHFGSGFLGRAGGLLLVSGLAEMTSPQAASPAGQLPSSSLPVPHVDGQGAAIPMVYGQASIVKPVIISSAFNVDIIR